MGSQWLLTSVLTARWWGGYDLAGWHNDLIRDQQRGRIRKETKMTTWKIMALAATTAVLISMLAEDNHFSRFVGWFKAQGRG